MRRVKSLLTAAALMAATTPAPADALRLRTDYSLTSGWSAASSLDTALGFQNRTTGAGNVRLIWDKSLGDFQLEIQSNLSFAQGDAIGYGAALAPFLPTPPPATYFDLARPWRINGTTMATNTIDRLSISYGSPHFVIKAGRQAITWGSGTVFQVSDIVAPFSPNALDTSYKPGVDMVYAQYLFDSGADIQTIWVPRAASFGGTIAFASSTFAARARMTLGPIDTGVMLARDRGDAIASLAFGGPLGGASWNVEYAQWMLASGTTHRSYLANISNFGTLFGRNISYFAEYYHNGFGVDAALPFDSLPASLIKRMSTGQVFNTGRDLLAFGGQMQITPDLMIAPNAMINLQDRSAVAGVLVNYTLDDNTNLVVNYLHPLGATGTEFGGRETTAGSGVYLGPSRSLTVQLVRYF